MQLEFQKDAGSQVRNVNESECRQENAYFLLFLYVILMLSYFSNWIQGLGIKKGYLSRRANN